MEDVFRKDDNTTAIEGRKKIYSVIQSLSLLLPSGKSDGVLKVGDLVYVAKKSKKNGKINFHFMVLKFVKTNKQKTIYTGGEQFFKRHIEELSNVEGDTANDDKNDDKNEKINKSEINYIVPAISGVGFGVIGYVLSKKYEKNPIVCSIIGVVFGLLSGHFIANKGLGDRTKIKKN